MSSPNAILEGAVILYSFSEHSLTWNIQLEGYSWGKLPEGSLVVDVGGGVGAQSLTLATHHSHLRFLIQDRKPTIHDAIEVCVFNPTSDCECVPEKDIDYSTGRRICLMPSSPGA